LPPEASFSHAPRVPATRRPQRPPGIRATQEAKRPLLLVQLPSGAHIALAAVVGGCVAVQQWAELPDIHVLAVGVLVAGIAWALAAVRCAPPPVRTATCALAMALAGIALATARAAARVEEALPRAWEGIDIVVVGVVTSLPSRAGGFTRFELDVEAVEPAQARLPQHIALSWQPRSRRTDSRDSTEGGDARADGVPRETLPDALHAGERWRLAVRLKRPHATLNFAGFDAEAWLFERDLRAVGYVRDGPGNRVVDAMAMSPVAWINRVRERLRERIEGALADAPYAGAIVALTIGDQQAVPEAQWRVFNRTGVSHLISISGLHITVFATVLGTLASGLARRSPALTSRVPARRIGVAAGAIAATLYTVLAGAEVPAQRTLVMLGVGAAGLLLARPLGASLLWLWALAVVIAIDPWAVVAPGFWLSFGAVGLLLYAGARRMSPSRPQGWRARGAAALHAQWVVTIGLVPITLALFQQFSLVAPLANAVAIPVVTFGVVFLALLGIVVPVDLLFVAAHATFAMLMRYLEWLASWPDASWQQHAPGAGLVVVALAGILWTLAPRGVPGRALGLAFLLPLWLMRPPPPAPGAFRATVLDVGQGLAAVVETHDHALLFDTGPRYGATSDAGGRIVVPNLRAMGVGRLDLMIVSHADADHSGGALSIVDAVPVSRIMSSLPDDNPINARMRRAATWCIAGTHWAWDGVRFDVLWPLAADYGREGVRTNDLSCVLRVEGQGASLLLTGDIEARDERILVGSGTELHADVLVVPHHGSRTSSTPAFIEAVAPSVAMITNGYRNRFGHPRPDVVARYRAAGATILRSDADGAVEFESSDGTSPPWRSARVAMRRYWHDRMEQP
jgi:competence protein ComEC